MSKLTDGIRTALGARLSLGLAWYRREQWERLREMAPDRDALEDTFDEWVCNAEASLLELVAEGQHIERVDLDTEALLACCNKHDLEPTSDNRAAYAAHLLRLRYGDDFFDA